MIVDAHLDLASNAASGRNVLSPAAAQVADADGIPTVGLPDLRKGGVGLICGTIFCMPALSGKPGYRNQEEAHAEAQSQLTWYRSAAASGELRLVTSRDELSAEAGASPACIVLLEGADAIRTPSEAREWHRAGVRIVGLAWRQTAYAGGTGAPGGLTAGGQELVRELDQCGMIHDVSHLAEQSFWELLELTERSVMASHSNCRAIVPTDRQLSDTMIRAIVQRGGVIGINFFDKFLVPPGEKRRATLADVVRHVQHICAIAGNSDHVGIGTDMDGGLGRDEIPIEIVSSADLPKVGEALRDAGFGDGEVEKIVAGNWLRFFSRELPE